MDSRRTKMPRLTSVAFKAAIGEIVQEAVHQLVPKVTVALQQVVREEMHRHLGNRSILTGTSLRSIDGSLDRPLYLQFTGNPPPKGFAEVDDWGQDLSVRLLTQNDMLVETGPESGAVLEVVALDGDFGKELWTADDFEESIQRERPGRRPLLLGNLSIALKNGEAKLGEVRFTDNSSCRLSKKFRLGIRVAEGQPGKDCIREAKTEAFRVNDSRGKSNEKHHPPCPQDDVWRLEHIRKDGPTHRKLKEHGVITVEEFCRAHEKPNNWLMNVLNMPIKKYDATVRHAKESETMCGYIETRSTNYACTAIVQTAEQQSVLSLSTEFNKPLAEMAQLPELQEATQGQQQAQADDGGDGLFFEAEDDGGNLFFEYASVQTAEQQLVWNLSTEFNKPFAEMVQLPELQEATQRQQQAQADDGGDDLFFEAEDDGGDLFFEYASALAEEQDQQAKEDGYLMDGRAATLVGQVDQYYMDGVPATSVGQAACHNHSLLVSDYVGMSPLLSAFTSVEGGTGEGLSKVDKSALQWRKVSTFFMCKHVWKSVALASGRRAGKCEN